MIGCKRWMHPRLTHRSSLTPDFSMLIEDPTKATIKIDKDSLTKTRYARNLELLLMEEILHHLGCKKKTVKNLSTGAGFLPSTVSKKCLMSASLPKIFAHMATFRLRKHRQKRLIKGLFGHALFKGSAGWRVNKFRSPDGHHKGPVYGRH